METQMKNFGSERMRSGRKDGVGLGVIVEAIFGPALGTLKGPAGNSSLWKMEENHCPLHAELPPLEMIRAAVLFSPLEKWALRMAEVFPALCTVAGCPARHPF